MYHQIVFDSQQIYFLIWYYFIITETYFKLLDIVEGKRKQHNEVRIQNIVRESSRNGVEQQ